jgi:glycosyltransferase involved in cell wall biosynthesis
VAAPAEPIRLLQVFNQYLESGGEEVWVNQIAGLVGEEVEVTELRFHSGEWMRKDAPSRIMQARRLWDNPRSRQRLSEVVENLKPDVLLYHNLVPVGSLGLYDHAARLGLPVVQYIHNFRPFSPSGTMWSRNRVRDGSLRGNPWPEVFGRAWERSFLQTFLLAAYQSRLVRSGSLNVVKRWIAVSDFMRDKFILAGLPADRVVSLRHCWYPQATPDASRMSGHYLFLGRLVPEKGIQTLLDAWSLLEARLGDACPRLIIAGSGPEEARVHAAAARMKKVVCTGFVSGTPKEDLLHGCRALIAPSIWWEPLGLIVYEAYDYARPVLAASSGGLTETVIPGVTGYLHAPGDPAALAADVEKMEAAGATKRLAMGHAGRDWLLANASPAEWRESFARILREAMETSS